VFLLWVVNFSAYVVVANWLGGDAVNGHAEAGRYFLGGHQTTEVSRAVFEFSRWYTYILWVHGAVTCVSAIIQSRANKRHIRVA
jgi:hypothetical protein